MALSSTEVSNFVTGLFDGLFREEDEERIMNQTRVSSHISEKSTIILMVITNIAVITVTALSL